MRKLTEKEIETLADVEGIDKEAVKNFFRSMGFNIIEELDKIVQNAKMFKWNKTTILVAMNGLWLSAGLPAQKDIKGKDING